MHRLPWIPGYELLAGLGGGPLTSVYSARDLNGDRPCAVKTLRDDWADPDTAIKLLQREARAGLTVQHPHLVRVVHTHVTRSPYFLVMELLPGESRVANVAYLLAAVAFIVGLKGLTHPRTAVRGNLIGSVGMLLAIIVTLIYVDVGLPVLIAGWRTDI